MPERNPRIMDPAEYATAVAEERAKAAPHYAGMDADALAECAAFTRSVRLDYPSSTAGTAYCDGHLEAIRDAMTATPDGCRVCGSPLPGHALPCDGPPRCDACEAAVGGCVPAPGPSPAAAPSPGFATAAETVRAHYPGAVVLSGSPAGFAATGPDALALLALAGWPLESGSGAGDATAWVPIADGERVLLAAAKAGVKVAVLMPEEPWAPEAVAS